MKSDVLAREKEKNNCIEKHNRFVFLWVLVITALIFSGSLKLDWTNWDDNLYVYENKVVSEGHLKDIFTKPGKYNTYNPLVIASFALEWRLVKSNPFLYHLDNVLLHLLCTALAFLFFRMMGLSVWWGGFAALLFGIHPMRVESVAWITERKDVLCALFYLSSLLAYIRYIVSGKRGFLLFTFIFFILSFFSKAQALTLPFALVLLDWYFQKKIDLKVIFEKALFFAVALAIFLPQYFFFSKVHYVTINSKAITSAFDFFEQVVLGGYVYVVYILKAVIPYVTCALYPIPALLKIEHWFGAAIAVALFISALAVWRKYRFVTFGLFFFTFNIGLLILLSFAASDLSFLNDHYAYIAYIGLFFVIAMFMQQLSYKFPLFRLATMGIAIALLLIFGILTIKYIPVWKNSETLWTYVIEKYPRKIPVAYFNRSYYWYKNNQSDKAIKDLNVAIELNPEYFLAYLRRGLIYLGKNDILKALHDYNRYLEIVIFYGTDTSGSILNPSVSEALGNRGVIYSTMGQYQKALIDFDLAIKLNPSNPNNYLNRAFAYYKLNRIKEAKKDLQIAEMLDATINPLFKKLLRLR